MTRLSEALRRAAEQSSPAGAAATIADAPPVWQFAPVDTMPVPSAPAGDSAVIPSARSLHPTSPRFGAADADKLVVAAAASSNLIEQYRHLAAVLHHAQGASGVKSVMVTSAIPSEGKTLTAANLALTLSESYQRRVLIIDADLRRPRMHEVFALPPTEGLSDSLAASRGGRLPVHPVTPHLWVLSAGHAVVDPMSSLVSPAMKQLLDEARESFDWVIVDTPPIAILPDANLLARMIDTTLLVISAQSTPYPMVQLAAKAIGTNRILGVVLNRAEDTNVPDSYAGYSSYYGRKPVATPKGRRRWFGWWRKRREKSDVQ